MNSYFHFLVYSHYCSARIFQFHSVHFAEYDFYRRFAKRSYEQWKLIACGKPAIGHWFRNRIWADYFKILRSKVGKSAPCLSLHLFCGRNSHYSLRFCFPTPSCKRWRKHEIGISNSFSGKKQLIYNGIRSYLTSMLLPL